MNKKFFALAAILLLLPMMVGAQTLKGSYFLDNSLNRNKMNPAFSPNVDYFQIPAIGNFGIGLYSNLGLNTFLFPGGDQLYTFLNQNVTFEQFDKMLAKNPYLDINADINLINFGWGWGRGYWTFDMGIKVTGDIDLPRDLFTFLKKGSALPGEYNIGAIKANALASAYVSLGYSRDFSDLVPGLSAGLRVRGIVPAGYVGANINQVTLSTSPDIWTLKTDGTLHTAVNGLIIMDEDGTLHPDFDFTQLGIPGWGFSVDFGAEYKLRFDGFINGVDFSFAATDLGTMFYNEASINAYKSSGSVEWTGLELSSLMEGNGGDVLNDLYDDFMKLLVLEEMEDKGTIISATTPSFYVGAEMPFCYDKMSIGLLYSARKSFTKTRHELTVSYNLNPCHWFAFGVNYSFLNTTQTLGWIIEFIPRIGPSLYIGSDYFFCEFAKAPDGFMLPILPMSMRFNLQLGISFTLGKGHRVR